MASIASFELVRERSPPRCLKAVCFPFLWPLLVFWVACHFDEVVFRGFLSIPRILTELRSEKFEWFGPSPIEPFNLGRSRRASKISHPLVRRVRGVAEEEGAAARAAAGPRAAPAEPPGRAPELKGSVGEGPNQTNYSDRSSVRILAKFRNFR